MDLLLSSIREKKQSHNRIKQRITGKKRKRYVRQGEIEQVQSREYLERNRLEEEEKQQKKRKLDHLRIRENFIPVNNTLTLPVIKKNEVKPNVEERVLPSNIPPRENVIFALREMGEPITLFGEADSDRFKRLRYHQTHDVQEERKENHRDRQMVDLLSEHEDAQDKLFLTEEEERVSQERLNLLEKTFNDKTLPKFNPEEHGDKQGYCLAILERLIRDWEAGLIFTPDENKRSLEFRRDREIHVQCKQYIQPLIKKLRSGSLSNDILDPLHTIMQSVVKGNYIQADVHFMKLSIGNSPWPMGVTNVGIHARSANEKIKTDSIAHVLNDEVQRKYIQSVKRLMTFAKRKYKKY